MRRTGRLILVILIAAVAALFALWRLGVFRPASEKAYDRAVKAIEEEKYEDAVTYLEAVIEKADPDEDDQIDHYIEAGYLLGDVSMQLGDENAANAYYKKAYAEDMKEREAPHKVTATNYLRRSRVLMDGGDYEAALEAVTQGLNCADVTCERELWYAEIICNENLHNWEQAKTRMQQYIEAYPDDANAWKDWEFLQTR